MKIDTIRLKSTRINENQQKLMKISKKIDEYENRWNSVKFGENQWKFKKMIFNDPTKVNYEDASFGQLGPIFSFFFFSRTTIQKSKKVRLCFVFF